MHQRLFSKMNEILILSPEHQEELTKLTTVQKFQKDSVILNHNEVSDHMHFIVRGGVRAVYYRDGKDITAWFAFEEDFVTSYESFVSRQPSQESIVAIADSDLISISHTSLNILYEKDMIWNKVGRLLLEKYYVLDRDRVLTLQSMSSAERYDEILRRHPDILEKVKLGYLASYLGITIDTLSRLRSTAKNRERIYNKLTRHDYRK